MFLHIFIAFQLPADSLQDAVITQVIADYNARDYGTFFYRELGRTLDESSGGVVYLALEDRITGERIPDIVEWLVVVPQGNRWTALLPGDPNYTASLDAFPRRIVTRLDDSDYRIRATPGLVSAADLRDYQLPWEDGRWATITRSYGRHGRGRIDFDVSSSTIAAAKNGTIIYANDTNTANGYSTGAWWYWNVVIIQHGDYEYSLYGHLAPNSLPEWIRDGCSDEYSQPNCNLSVRAGEVIGREGNTGYSAAPHLHFEIGQGFGIAGYATSPTTTAYAGYVYAEHNAGFSGYTAMQASRWRYGRLLQATHQTAPPDTELVRDGSFSDGTSEWTPSGQLNWSVQDGVMRFLRLNTTEPPQWASFYQDFGWGAPANAAFEIRFSLGNSIAFDKTVTVSLRNTAGRDYGVFECRFRVAANTPLQPYVIRGQTHDSWANVRLEFSVNPPDSTRAALIDDVSAQILPSESVDETECIAP